MLLPLSGFISARDGIVKGDFLKSWPSLPKTDLQLIKKRVARNPSVLSGRVERVVVGVN